MTAARVETVAVIPGYGRIFEGVLELVSDEGTLQNATERVMFELQQHVPLGLLQHVVVGAMWQDEAMRDAYSVMAVMYGRPSYHDAHHTMPGQTN